MKKLLKTLAIGLAVVFTIGCEKDNVVPEEPKEEKILLPVYRLKVYYTKLNLIDTTYIKEVVQYNQIIVETKVVPKGDISITNFREGKYDLVDSTDYRVYRTRFEFEDYWKREGTGDNSLFSGLYKEGYIHKVVVEMSVDSEIDSTRSRVEKMNNRTFILQFTEITHDVFRDHYLKRWSGYRKKPLYYIEDLIDEPVDTDTYLEFKEVPYYNYESTLYKYYK